MMFPSPASFVDIHTTFNHYDIIYADPPWRYGEKMSHSGSFKEKRRLTSAETHYPTMSIEDLVHLPVICLGQPNSLLFLWATGPQIKEAVELLQAWGFVYITVAFVWEKGITLPGNYTMSSSEFCLVGKRGRIPKPRGARNIKQFYYKKRGGHSAKPDEFGMRINQMFPEQRKIELFSRSGDLRYYDGTWDYSGGDEVVV